MKGWLTTLAYAAIFRTGAYVRIRDRRDAFFLGFVLVVAAALFAGLPVLLSGTFAALGPAPSEVGSGDLVGRVESALLNMAPFLADLPVDQREQLLANVGQAIETWTEISTQIAELDTFFPRPVGRMFAGCVRSPLSS